MPPDHCTFGTFSLALIAMPVGFQFLCEPNDLYAVKKELEARQLPVRSAEVVFFTTSTVPLEPGTLDLIAKVMEKLDDHPDVLKVYTNVVEAT